MADAKKKQKEKLEFIPKDFKGTDLKPETLKKLLGSKGIDPVKYEVEYDPDSIEKKELKESAAAFMGGAVKLFLDTHIKQGTAPEEAWKAFKNLVEKKTLKNWQKEINKEAGGGGAAKELGEGKELMKDLQKVNTDAIETTRTEVLKAIEPLAKGQPDKRKIQEANGKLTKLKKEFEKDGKVAQDAIAFMDDSADEWEKSKEDKVKGFGKLVNKEGKKVFSPFLDAIYEFSGALEEAIEVTKGEAMDEGKAAELKATFTRLSNLKSTAKAAVNAGKRLKKAYDDAVK